MPFSMNIRVNYRVLEYNNRNKMVPKSTTGWYSNRL